MFVEVIRIFIFLVTVEIIKSILILVIKSTFVLLFFIVCLSQEEAWLLLLCIFLGFSCTFGWTFIRILVCYVRGILILIRFIYVFEASRNSKFIKETFSLFVELKIIFNSFDIYFLWYDLSLQPFYLSNTWILFLNSFVILGRDLFSCVV